MGLLIKGRWSTDWYGSDEQGRFIREPTKFGGWVTRDGRSGFAAEPGRYHLYVSHACPWSHRTSLMRKLKGLTDVVSMSSVDPFMGDDGWWFSDAEGAGPDPIHGAQYLRDVYLKARPDYTGRVTVPVLWDRRENTIVSNASRDIVRMLDHEFVDHARGPDYCPEGLEDAIDREIDALYDGVNNAVYLAGFATTQRAYDEAVGRLFEALDGYEERLSRQRYLCADVITEADWFLFVTLVRFDLVYHYHFKCNLRKISEYPELYGFLRDLYQRPGIAETCRFDHIKQHYYRSHPTVNPQRIVPVGPLLELNAPHDRGRFGSAPDV